MPRERPSGKATKDRPGGLSRRGFLKAVGFSAPAALAACSRAPVEKAIPFLVQPEGVVPGRSTWYASTCMACEAACGMLVKCRDGRPIKLEGNPQHPLSRGGLCARGQAGVLELYDSRRLASPLEAGKPTSFPRVDARVMDRLDRLRSGGGGGGGGPAGGAGAVRFLSGTVVSPTLKGVLERFLAGFPDARHVAYDPLSRAAILEAHARTHGARVLPRYRFERAEVVVALEADFLGTWISPVEHAASWQERRRPDPESPRMSYHCQIESRLSLTGSKADRRWPVRPGRLGEVLASLDAALSARAGVPPAAPAPSPSPSPRGGPVAAAEIDELAGRLWKARGRALVVCGANDTRLQILANHANHLLGSYGSTIELERPSRQASGSDRELRRLLDELRQGKVAALLIAGVNPAYDLARVPRIEELLRSPSLLVSFARWEDETSRLADFVCPDHHPLESWGDAEPVAGVVTPAQPAIAPLGNTRALIETLSLWTRGGQGRQPPAPALEILRETWRREMYPRSDGSLDFDAFWDRALERGVAELSAPAPPLHPFNMPASRVAPGAASAPDMELVLHPTVAMGDGRHALNPWLHELPDPLTKVTWDHVASLSPGDAARLGLAEGDLVRIEAHGGGDGGKEGPTPGLELPVFVQPGQAQGTVAVGLGYGRAGSERFAGAGPRWIGGPAAPAHPAPVGASAAGLIAWGEDGSRRFTGSPVRVEPLGRRRPLARTQTQGSLEVPARLALPGAGRRETVREVSLAALAEPQAGGGSGGAEGSGGEPSLWPDDHPYTGHHWGLVVDLNACTGCSACVIACQAENNIPVVGRDEVRRRREMHWLRIDTYSSGDGEGLEVCHQPMMCQQCDHAPCETVCPVLATVHSEEGLNEQVYNRCVGTRYCANNCPYKVRRFNWFNYHKRGRRTDLVLNPDVTVRSRGVMEKCTFCAQRIMEGKLEAKAAGTPLADGAIRTACEQSCPAHAIVFGDLNDPQSRLARQLASPRRFGVLEELGVRPSVSYLAIVRRRGGEPREASHG